MIGPAWVFLRWSGVFTQIWPWSHISAISLTQRISVRKVKHSAEFRQYLTDIWLIISISGGAHRMELCWKKSTCIHSFCHPWRWSATEMSHSFCSFKFKCWFSICLSVPSGPVQGLSCDPTENSLQVGSTEDWNGHLLYFCVANISFLQSDIFSFLGLVVASSEGRETRPPSWLPSETLLAGWWASPLSL